MFVAFLGNRKPQVKNRAITVVVDHEGSRFFSDALCMGKHISSKINLSLTTQKPTKRQHQGNENWRRTCSLQHNLDKLARLPFSVSETMVSCMQSFKLDSIQSKELYKDVLVKLTHGNDLTLNYFELKNQDVNIPCHTHPVEHLVVVMEGEIEFVFDDQKLVLKKKDCLFVPAKIQHTARVIEGPVKALEIYKVTEDEYYKR